MYILRLISHQMLGARWVYYRKIKRAGEGHKILREKTLMEQMKATQAALRFTSRATSSLYRVALGSCLQDISTYTGIKKSTLPALSQPQESKTNEAKQKLTADHDGIIVTWTPLKFLLPAKSIREKGCATQRHTEGLIAKLFFKVTAYYAVAENWDTEKLTLYLRKIDENTSSSDVMSTLRNIKNDLLNFANSYQLFKFGTASLSKDSISDESTFDDTIGMESVEDQVKTLYWYGFIYMGMEAFLFKYFLTLITSTKSMQAVCYLAQIFKPALEKAIEVNNQFMVSFETDRSKKVLRESYEKYVEQCAKEPLKKKLKTADGLFETYNYTYQLLERTNIGFQLNEIPMKNSEWGKFVENRIFKNAIYESANSADGARTSSIQYRDYIVMHIINAIVNCN